MKNKTSWGNVANWYDGVVKDDDSYQKNVILPNILRIIDPKEGMRIVDIACGQGYFSNFFAERGAQVTGLDISKELIDIAKENSNEIGLENKPTFYVSSADNLSVLKDGNSIEGVDVSIIVLALQNIEDLYEVVSEASRILKDKGRFVLVLNHPAFRIPKRSDWGWDEKTQTQYRRIDSYMSDSSSKIDMNPGEKRSEEKEFTISFHRPLQSYFKALSKAGLSIIRLEEWISHKKSKAGTRSAEEDRMRKEIPMFVCIEARKI